MHDQAHNNSVEIEDKNYLKTFSSLREKRAKAILNKDNPEKVDEITYLVPSQTDSTKK